MVTPKLSPRQIKRLLEKDHSLLKYTFENLGQVALSNFIKNGHYKRVMDTLIAYRNYRFLKELNPHLDLVKTRKGFNMIDREKRCESQRQYELRRRNRKCVTFV